MFITISLESYDFTNVSVEYAHSGVKLLQGDTHSRFACQPKLGLIDDVTNVRFILVYTMKIHNSTLNTDIIFSKLSIFCVSYLKL